MKTTALLTGRGNNSLKDKNILKVLGKSLLYYPAHAARMAKSIDSWYCSSDDNKILEAAQEEGYTPIMRPPEYALPNAQHIDCILHALQFMKQNDDLPDILVVLLANNVSVKSQWIDDCVRIKKEHAETTAVVPVYEDNDHHPLRAKTINNDGFLNSMKKMFRKQFQEIVKICRVAIFCPTIFGCWMYHICFPENTDSNRGILWEIKFFLI